MSNNFQEKTAVEDEDPVTLMLQKTGCINLHYKVQVREGIFAIVTSNFHLNSSKSQDCMSETGDWRKCQEVVKEFKDCMKVYTDHQRKKYGN